MNKRDTEPDVKLVAMIPYKGRASIVKKEFPGGTG